MDNRMSVIVKGIIISEGEFLIIKRSEKDEYRPCTWEFAGGKIDFGEELEEALKREVMEEVGLNIEIEKLLYATTFFTDPTRQVVILTYKCTAKDGKVNLSAEHSEYKWATWEEMKALVHPDIVEDLMKYNVSEVIGS